MLASLALVASILARKVVQDNCSKQFGFDGLDALAVTTTGTSVSPDDGQVLVQIEYLIDISKSNEFKARYYRI